MVFPTVLIPNAFHSPKLYRHIAWFSLVDLKRELKPKKALTIDFLKNNSRHKYDEWLNPRNTCKHLLLGTKRHFKGDLHITFTENM